MKEVTKTQKGAFYGYNYYLDEEGSFVGEGSAGSKAFYIFTSKAVFEAAVTSYNVIGSPPVASAAKHQLATPTDQSR